MIKIVKGNDVVIRFPFYEKTPDNSVKALIIEEELENLQVAFIPKRGDEIVSNRIAFNESSLDVIIPASLEVGQYSVRMTFVLDGVQNVCSMIKDCFSIVQYNSEANLIEHNNIPPVVADSTIITREAIDQYIAPTTETDTESEEELNIKR